MSSTTREAIVDLLESGIEENISLAIITGMTQLGIEDFCSIWCQHPFVWTGRFEIPNTNYFLEVCDRGSRMMEYTGNIPEKRVSYIIHSPDGIGEISETWFVQNEMVKKMLIKLLHKFQKDQECHNRQ